ncbi:MAG: TRAP transporter substrate-binding protein [Candidatus Rariloculaceae bacterium]
MSRRRFLKASALLGASSVTGGLGLSSARAQPSVTEPWRIIIAGYGPSTTSFSRGLDFIGERLTARFDDSVELRYIYNVSDVGYRGAADLHWMVESGVLGLAYATMSTGIPALEIAALPFLFQDTQTARAAMDGPLGEAAIRSIEEQNNYRVLGFFENGFRHVSNDIRPVHTPDDLSGLSIRLLGVQERTFELLGAEPRTMPLADALPLLEDGTIDGQENPFENTVSYGPYLSQRYHTATFHSYLSRPIFVNRDVFDGWPASLQSELRTAVRDAIDYQRELHDQAEIDSQEIIREAGGEIVTLNAAQREEFVSAVAPIYADARSQYSRELLSLVDL